MNDPITQVRRAMSALYLEVPEAVAKDIGIIVEAGLAAAFAQGYASAIDDYGCDIPWGGTTSKDNPYEGN